MPRDSHLLLGLDVGTSGTKAILIDAANQGAVLASATAEYPLSTPRPGWAEQDPAHWWKATADAVAAACALAQVLPSDVQGVGLTGQMHGLVALDAHGDVIRPAILWNDQRTAAQCEAIHERVGFERVLALTGNPVLPGFTAPKILWMREHEPDAHARIRHVLLPKDYVRFCLSGVYAGDVSDASGTSMFDVGQRAWSREMTDAMGFDFDWLPEVHESFERSATVNAAGAAATGLREGTPIVAGAGDQAAQAVGSGIVREGLVSCTIGTSGVVFASCDSYRTDPQGRLHAFCHAVPDTWHMMGVMLSAGGSLRWYRDTLGQSEISEAEASGDDPYDILLKAAAEETEPGCEGLTFLPYLTGERTPHPDPDARGVFSGLSLRHTKAHLTRAVVEGVTFGLRDSLELMRAQDLAATQIRVSGGGARSDFWRQMLADVFALPVVTVNANEGAAFGAALLAGVGTGCWADVPSAAAEVIEETGLTEPGADVGTYAPYYERYRSLYRALAGEFKAMARVLATEDGP